MSFCKEFKELYDVDQKGYCPWHAYLTPTHVNGGACAVPDSTVADLSSAQFNHFDTRCDDRCEYFIREYTIMTACYSCGNCCDGFAQCSCYKEPSVDSDQCESSDDNVFSPKPCSGSPDSTKP